MPIGNVTETIRDGGLGIVPSSISQTMVVLGTSQGGTANTLYSFSTIDDISSTLIAGEAAELAAYVLSVAGGSVYVMPLNASVAGVAGAVTPTRVATSTSVMTTTGTVYDGFNVIVTVVSAGTGQLVTSGAVQIKVSLDGGLTQGPAVIIPAAGTITGLYGTALNLVFTTAASANLDFGDKFAFTCQAPFYSATDLNNAFSALFLLPNTWSLVALAGYPTVGASAANATSSATIATALDTNMQTGATNFRYAHAVMQAPPSADGDLQTAYLNFSSAQGRVKVEAGTCPLMSPLTGRQITRGWSYTVAARLKASRPSVSPGQVGLTDGGPMKGVVSITRDERKTPGLFDSRFGVSLTYLGVPGFFADLGKTMAASNSDFTYVMNGRVLDAACTSSRAALLQFLNSPIRVNASNGTILEQDARAIENYVENAVRAAIGTEISPDSGSSKSVQIIVNRTTNILSTSQLLVKTRVIPVGYAGSISEDIGFLNPSLIPV